jgi:copper transport protein
MTTRPWGRAIAALLIVVTMVGLFGGTASAHVEVVRTDPPDGSVLSTSPSRITLSFTDTLALDLASVELRTASGTRVVVDKLTLGADRNQLVVTLPTLAKEAYRLSYQVRDPVDLHQTTGSIVFGIGTTPVIDGGADRQGAKFAESLFGWLARSGLVALVGAVGMIMMLRLRKRHATDRKRFIATAIFVARVGSIALILGEVISITAQVLDVGGPTGSTVWRLLVHSSYGHRFLATTTLAIGMLLFLRTVSPLLLRDVGARWSVAEVGIVIIVVALVVLAAFASHAGIGGNFAAGVLLRVGHLVGIGIWVGGLIVLVVARRRFGATLCVDVLRSFSPIAVAGVALTTATGLLLAGREVRSLTALFSTGFGDVLIVKVALVAVVLALGGWHAVVVRRGRRIGARTLVLEAMVALGVVLGGAALATAGPAVGARFEPSVEVLPTNDSHKVDDLLVRLTIGPSRPGRNLVRVEFIDSRRPAPTPPESVTVTMTDASGERITRSGGPPLNGIIDLDAADITAPGPVRVTVQPARSSRPVPAASFDWTIGATPVQHARTVISDRSLAPISAWASAVILVGAAALQLARFVGRRRL